MYCHCEHLKYILPGCRPTRMTVSSVLDLCIKLLLLIIPACLATSTTPAPGESLWYPPLSLSVTPFSFSSLSSLSLASSISLSYPLPYFLLITLRLSLSSTFLLCGCFECFVKTSGYSDKWTDVMRVLPPTNRRQTSHHENTHTHPSSPPPTAHTRHVCPPANNKHITSHIHTH